MMKRTVTACLAAAVLAGSLSAGCSRPEDWSDPAYIASMMEVGEQRAFDEFTRLSPEQQAEVIPTLVDLYDKNFRRDAVVQALVQAADPAGRDVFMSALDETDALAAQAARGLAAIGDTAAATAIAQRLAEVNSADAYAPFLEALMEIPTAAAGDVVAEMLMRPAPRIGGVTTVRLGCRFLGTVEDPSDAAIDAMVFGLVNVIPEPYSDALKDCELALVRHGDRAASSLLTLFRGENGEINNHLRSLRYRPPFGQLYAAGVLSSIHNDATNAGLIEWFSTEHEVPFQELRQMDEVDQSDWYNKHGQMFMWATKALAYRGSEADLATLRALESTEPEENLLSNFSGWFELSAGAEFGLRTAVHEGLGRIGTDEDRALLWSRALEGTVTRGGEFFTYELRKNALHNLGRTARPGELARYDEVYAAQPESQLLVQFAEQRAYFVLAEECGEDAACYAGIFEDTAPVMNNESVTAALAAVEDEALRGQLTERFEVNARAGAAWQLALRFGDQAIAGETLVANIGHSSLDTRLNIAEALRYVDTLPGDWRERLETWIEEDIENRGVPAQDYRHQLRLVLTSRS